VTDLICPVHPVLQGKDDRISAEKRLERLPQPSGGVRLDGEQHQVGRFTVAEVRYRGNRLDSLVGPTNDLNTAGANGRELLTPRCSLERYPPRGSAFGASFCLIRLSASAPKEGRPSETFISVGRISEVGLGNARPGVYLPSKLGFLFSLKAASAS